MYKPQWKPAGYAPFLFPHEALASRSDGYGIYQEYIAHKSSSEAILVLFVMLSCCAGIAMYWVFLERRKRSDKKKRGTGK